MSPGDSTVLFRALPAESRLSPAERREVRKFAAALTRELAEGRRFTCLLTSDEEIRRLNAEFRKQDKATDVLSFPALGRESGQNPELGDIAISVERATAQAVQLGHSRAEEICILILHGLLHLQGFDHEQDSGEMARVEAGWRDRFGLPETLLGIGF